MGCSMGILNNGVSSEFCILKDHNDQNKDKVEPAKHEVCKSYSAKAREATVGATGKEAFSQETIYFIGKRKKF